MIDRGAWRRGSENCENSSVTNLHISHSSDAKIARERNYANSEGDNYVTNMQIWVNMFDNLTEIVSWVKDLNENLSQ